MSLFLLKRNILTISYLPATPSWGILPCLLFFASLAHAADLDWKTLRQGHVIISSIEDNQGVPGVRAMFLVNAERQDIWSTLVDYENFPKIFEDIDKMEVHSSDGNGAHVEFWIDVLLTDLHYVLYRDYKEPGYRLTWKRVSGDMKDIHGSWQILDTLDPEHKLLIYESFVDIGFSVVTWTIRLSAKKKAEKIAYRLREWIEQEKNKSRKSMITDLSDVK